MLTMSVGVPAFSMQFIFQSLFILFYPIEQSKGNMIKRSFLSILDFCMFLSTFLCRFLFSSPFIPLLLLPPLFFLFSFLSFPFLSAFHRCSLLFILFFLFSPFLTLVISLVSPLSFLPLIFGYRVPEKSQELCRILQHVSGLKKNLLRVMQLMQSYLMQNVIQHA